MLVAEGGSGGAGDELETEKDVMLQGRSGSEGLPVDSQWKNQLAGRQNARHTASWKEDTKVLIGLEKHYEEKEREVC